jgi:hypothetical protein
MTHGHTFWFWLVWACVIWYSTITFYVSVKGVLDIKHMLRNLEETHTVDTKENADKKS